MINFRLNSNLHHPAIYLFIFSVTALPGMSPPPPLTGHALESFAHLNIKTAHLHINEYVQ